MATRRSQGSKKSQTKTIGGQWLPNLLTWGGVILMIVGGIFAYPTLQAYLAPPDAQSLEFSVTLPPPQLSPQPTAPASGTDAAAVAAEPTPSAEPTETAIVPTATATAPPPVILPETEILTPTSTAEIFPEAQVTITATAEPTPTPTPLPTIDPASLVPSRLVIPAIGLDAPVVEVGWETQTVNGQTVSNWLVPHSFAAGWHKTSAPPGQVGNTVLNGHHNIHGEVFRDLVELEPGDEIAIYAGEKVYYYNVTERYILEEKGEPVEVRLQNAQWIMPTADERLTLVTCWPYTNNTHRLVVVAQPAHPTPTPIPMEQ